MFFFPSSVVWLVDTLFPGCLLLSFRRAWSSGRLPHSYVKSDRWWLHVLFASSTPNAQRMSFSLLFGVKWFLFKICLLLFVLFPGSGFAILFEAKRKEHENVHSKWWDEQKLTKKKNYKYSIVQVLISNSAETRNLVPVKYWKMWRRCRILSGVFVELNKAAAPIGFTIFSVFIKYHSSLNTSLPHPTWFNALKRPPLWQHICP